MIETILMTIGIACVLSTLLILSLALTARPPQAKREPLTQAEIDRIEQ